MEGLLLNWLQGSSLVFLQWGITLEGGREGERERGRERDLVVKVIDENGFTFDLVTWKLVLVGLKDHIQERDFTFLHTHSQTNLC